MKQLDFYDKSSWMQGPWMEEPDYQAWIDADTDYACVARRNFCGAWNGFVGLDPRHPLYETPLESEEFNFIDVHGNVQFANCNTAEDISFYPAIRRWWVGFDCMEETDLCPALADDNSGQRKGKKKDTKMIVYRDLQYVRLNILTLAEQLALVDTRIMIATV